MKTKLALFLIILGIFGFASRSAVERLAPATRSLRYAPSAMAAGRLDAIIEEAYDVAAAKPLFGGTAGAEATALLLYSIMYHESGLRPHIERCDCTKGDGDCDRGRAFGLPQIHAQWFQGRSRDDVCADRRLQMRLAMDLLQHVKSMCGGDPERIAAGYHHGTSCDVDGYAANVGHVFTGLLMKAEIRMYRTSTGAARFDG
jgi:hypothetical protein